MPGIKIARHFFLVLELMAFWVAFASANAGEPKSGGKDAEGAPLPGGALSRLGTLRWRHGDAVTFLALPEDGKTLITATQDSILRIWNRETGLETRRLVAPGEEKANARPNFYMQGITRAAMSKDGRFLAVALQSGPIQVWEVASGKPVCQIKTAANGIGSMAFTPDGKTLVFRGVSDRVAHLHETETGKELRTLKPVPPGGKGGNIFGGPGDGTGIAISPNGKTIALPELEFNNQRVSGSVTLFEIDSGKEIRRIEMPTNGISAIAFSPDGKTLAFNTHSAIFFKDAESGKEIRQIRNINGANLIVWTPDGKSLAVKGRDGVVRLFDTATGNLVRTLGELAGPRPGNAGFVGNPNGAITTDVAFTSDGKTLILGGQHVPRFIEVATGKEQPLQGGGHQGAVTSVLISSDGKTVVSRGAEGTLRVWNAATGIEMRQISEPAGASSVVFSPDGTTVAFGMNDGNVRLVGILDGKEKSQIKAHQGTIAALAFSADGNRLATRGCYDGLLKTFDVARGSELKQMTYQDLDVGNGGGAIFRAVTNQRENHPLAYSPDGTMLATYIAPQQILVQGRQQTRPDSNVLRFFDAVSGKEIRSVAMPPGRTISHLVFSLDGRLLYSENNDKTVTVWEVASGQERTRLGAPVTAVTQPTSTSFVAINAGGRTGPALSPIGSTLAATRDGSLLAFPGPDNKIRVYDIPTGKEIGLFEGHLAALSSLEFAPDGRTLISGSTDTTMLTWDVTRLKREQPPVIANMPLEIFDRLWADLVSADAARAGQSVQTLIAGGGGAVAHLKDRIQPALPVDPKKVEQWVRDLDNGSFTKRAQAIRELERTGELAVPALKKVLEAAPSLETRRRVEPLLEELTGRNLTPEQLRAVRVVEILERIGSPEARQVLQQLAGGAPGALTTRHAEASLNRTTGIRK